MFLKPTQLLRFSTFISARTSQVFYSKNAITSPAPTPTEGITISENCAKKLKQLCGKNNNFLRLCVESGGCSGFQYKFDLDNKMADDDRIFERDGAKVVIDETSLDYIRGSTIDYHTELIRSAFRVIQNPNADLGCSCGASFSIKLD